MRQGPPDRAGPGNRHRSRVHSPRFHRARSGPIVRSTLRLEGFAGGPFQSSRHPCSTVPGRAGTSRTRACYHRLRGARPPDWLAGSAAAFREAAVPDTLKVLLVEDHPEYAHIVKRMLAATEASAPTVKLEWVDRSEERRVGKECRSRW